MILSAWVTGVHPSPTPDAGRPPLRLRGVRTRGRSDREEFPKKADMTRLGVVQRQTLFLFEGDDLEEWKDEARLKMERRYQTTTDSGGMGILSDTAWDRRWLTMRSRKEGERTREDRKRIWWMRDQFVSTVDIIKNDTMEDWEKMRGGWRMSLDPKHGKLY